MIMMRPCTSTPMVKMDENGLHLLAPLLSPALLTSSAATSAFLGHLHPHLLCTSRATPPHLKCNACSFASPLSCYCSTDNSSATGAGWGAGTLA
jgi:hypothetical protein